MTFLVCGDSMEDIYIKGETSRISPEAPVAIVKVLETVTKPGGAANVRMNVQTLGMEARGLYSYTSLTNPVQKVRVLSRSQQMLRLDYDHRQAPIAPEVFEPEPWIIFSDYGKGSLDNIKDLINKAPASTIFVDPRGMDYERYRGASYIKPNTEEMRDLVGNWSTGAQLDEKAGNVVKHLELEGLLLTQGANGMTLYTSTFKYHSPAVTHEVFDVCGAGDTSLAAFAVAIARDYTDEEAVFYASKAAGITCQHLGSYSPSEKEVFSGSD